MAEWRRECHMEGPATALEDTEMAEAQVWDKRAKEETDSSYELEAKTTGIGYGERSRMTSGSAPTTIREEQPATKRTRFERGRPGDSVV